MSIEELVNTQVEVTQRAIKSFAFVESYPYLEKKIVLLMIPFFILVSFFVISAFAENKKRFQNPPHPLKSPFRSPGGVPHWTD